MEARHPATKPVSNSWLLALLCLYMTINNFNNSRMIPFRIRNNGLVWKGRMELSSKKDIAGMKPALSMSLWSEMILLKTNASVSISAVKRIFPNMPLDPSRKERYPVNLFQMDVALSVTTVFAFESPVIPGRKASKASMPLGRGVVVFNNVLYTVFDLKFTCLQANGSL